MKGIDKMTLLLEDSQELNFKDKIIYQTVLDNDLDLIYQNGVILLNNTDEEKYIRYRIGLETKIKKTLDNICIKAMLNDGPLNISMINKEFERVKFDILVPRNTNVKLDIESIGKEKITLLDSVLSIDKI